MERRPTLVGVAALLLVVAGLTRTPPTDAPTPAFTPTLATAPAPPARPSPTPITPVAVPERVQTTVPAVPAPQPIATAAAIRWDVPDAVTARMVYDIADDPRLDVYETRIDPQSGGRVSGRDGVEIVFAADTLTQPDGTPLEGPVSVRWTHVDQPDQVTAVPGTLATDDDVPLQSFGMVRVQLTHPEHQVVLTTPARLSFPLMPGHDFDDGDDVGIYVLDVDLGHWKHIGDGTVEDGRFKVPMARQGWWNCDRPLAQRGCVRGTIEHPNWTLPEGTMAQLVGVRYITRSAAPANEDGSFCVDGMPNVEARIEAYQTGAQCFRLESRMVQASEPGTSCFEDDRACTPVVLTPVPVSCEVAIAGQNRANRVQVAAADADPLRRRVSRWPLDLVLPKTAEWAELYCGNSFRDHRRVTGGRANFMVPRWTGGECTLEAGGRGKGWRLDGLYAGMRYRCTHDGKHHLECVEEKR